MTLIRLDLVSNQLQFGTFIGYAYIFKRYLIKFRV